MDQDLTGGAIHDPPEGAALPLAAAGSALSSFTDAAGEHICYLDPNRHVHQLYYDHQNWHDQDLTAAIGGPLAAAGSAITSFADASGEHIGYLTPDQHVHQLYYDHQNWMDQDLTAFGVLLPAPTWANTPATNITDHSVTLHWKSVPTAQSYHIDASLSATGVVQTSAQAGAGATSCTVNGLSPGTQYMFSLTYALASGQHSAAAALGVQTSPPPLVVVPAVVALTLTQALAALNRVGLQLGMLVNPSGQIQNDLLKVASQAPGPGTRLHVGDSVDLYVTPINQPVPGYSQVQVANGSNDGQPVEVWLINLATNATVNMGSVGFNAQKTFPLQNGISFEIVAVDVTMSGCPGSDPTNLDCQRTIGFATGMRGGPTYPMQVL